VKTIRLINLDRDKFDLIIQDPRRFCAQHGILVGEGVAHLVDVAVHIRASTRMIESDFRWFVYCGVDVLLNNLVGICLFKGPPASDRSVEIAYFTLPELEGQGYGTAMAFELIRIAFASNEVDLIVAHTLPMSNASTRILQKIGMDFAGEAMDPQDGRVWRWVLHNLHTQ
jgi:RimJ/RimL family protein N-acetyltransferase